MINQRDSQESRLDTDLLSRNQEGKRGSAGNVPDSGRRGCRREGHEHGPTQCRSYHLLLLFNTRTASASSPHMDGHAQLFATTQPGPENLESPPLSSARHGHNPPSSAATVRISNSSGHQLESPRG